MRRNLVKVRTGERWPSGRHAKAWAWHDLKGHKPRYLPLAAPTVAALKAHRARTAAERLQVGPGWVGARILNGQGHLVDADLVFHRPDGSPLSPNDRTAALDAVCEKAGAGRWTAQDLRYVAVTLLADAGVPLATIQQLAGHADERTTDRHYTGRLDRSLREAVDLLAELLG